MEKYLTKEEIQAVITNLQELPYKNVVNVINFLANKLQEKPKEEQKDGES
jgi:hypothetical protein